MVCPRSLAFYMSLVHSLCFPSPSSSSTKDDVISQLQQPVLLRLSSLLIIGFFQHNGRRPQSMTVRGSTAPCAEDAASLVVGMSPSCETLHLSLFEVLTQTVTTVRVVVAPTGAHANRTACWRVFMEADSLVKGITKLVLAL